MIMQFFFFLFFWGGGGRGVKEEYYGICASSESIDFPKFLTHGVPRGRFGRLCSGRNFFTSAMVVDIETFHSSYRNHNQLCAKHSFLK